MVLRWRGLAVLLLAAACGARSELLLDDEPTFSPTDPLTSAQAPQNPDDRGAEARRAPEGHLESAQGPVAAAA
ncbi:MAG: hypothetical protein B6A08_08930 [Sorangiineae bacterium NIC37A_2]|nr:MAG: hypothetical protein B6A08_08930 [Sorangiineae bacterium NIC37A_2]